jgi:hypothetical protein
MNKESRNEKPPAIKLQRIFNNSLILLRADLMTTIKKMNDGSPVASLPRNDKNNIAFGSLK